MLTAIFSVLPDWAVATIIGALAWFGVNYVWLAPMYFQASVKQARSNGMPCGGGSTTFEDGSGPLKFDMALYTASIGLVGHERSIITQGCKTGGQ